jgi:FkbM family methyltransferase
MASGTEHIRTSSRFTSVRLPYERDSFTASDSRSCASASDAVAAFAGFLATRRPPLLDWLLEECARLAGPLRPLAITDIGVFMGNFAVAAALTADRLGIARTLAAYEANPELIAPIRRNLALYGLEGQVTLHNNGIGGQRGTLEFSFRPDGLIGGSLAVAPADAARARVACEVLPLAEVLSADPAPGLVKIDIEGVEPDAFGSIAADPDRLANAFIVEFAPWQAGRRLGGTTYGAFLLEVFDVYNIGNWLWVPFLEPVPDAAALAAVCEGKRRQHNTDLLLLPRALPELRDALEARLRAG